MQRMRQLEKLNSEYNGPSYDGLFFCFKNILQTLVENGINMI